MTDNKDYTISELSEEFGVTLRAIRFYESKNLLSPLRDGKKRIYSMKQRRRLEIIVKGKRLGFSLREISEQIQQTESNPQNANKVHFSYELLKEQEVYLETQQKEIAAALAELRDTIKEAEYE